MSFVRLAPFLLLSIFFLYFSSSQQAFDYPSSHLNTTWTNSASSLLHSVDFTDGSRVRATLLKGTLGPRFACGFFCNGTCDRYLFSVFIVQTDSASFIVMPSFGFPQVVWSANRDRLVRENATVELTVDGNLVLRDADGALVWSTNTSGKGVTGLQLEDTGNLVLADKTNKTVWQSFDHPTDVLVLGQVLTSGRQLVASVSSSNHTQGPYYLSMEKDGLFLYAAAPEPQRYWGQTPSVPKRYRKVPYAVYNNGSIDIFVSNLNKVDVSILFPATNLTQYIRIDPDGILRVYAWSTDTGWHMVYDFLAPSIVGPELCSVPSGCGLYGLCTDGECSCLQASSGNSTLPTDSFTAVNSRRPAEGCVPYAPLVCDSRNGSGDHHFLQVNNVEYFSFEFLDGNTTDSLDECKNICLQNCSCKAAFYVTSLNDTELQGTCYSITEVYTLKTNSGEHYNSVVLIKMQNTSLPASPSIVPGPPGIPQKGNKTKTSNTPLIVGTATSLGIVTIIPLIIMGCVYKRRGSKADAEDDSFLTSVPGLPSRFPFSDLRNATENFRNKLGSGGFGSVFLGILPDGTRVAVKRLESSRQGQKEFRAEVCTIGSIHHLNLVRLCGFCAEREHRLLVYELMPNGSLDRWLFSTDHASLLDWDTRFSIGLGTAQGLAYLHEECRERISHLDVKPQNILLDERFVAKVSDFGLSKFMDRDQSQVVTTMRGTPGYLAPEWLHSTVTEKADVYSFGIVLLEIVSGRKCLDSSNADSERAYLPAWANLKAEEGKLVELVDDRLGRAFDEEQAVRTINVALWCIQGEAAGRPSMSSVVQLLEGVMELEPPPLNFPHFWNPQTRLVTDGKASNNRDVGCFNSINSWSRLPKESIPIASDVSAPR